MKINGLDFNVEVKGEGEALVWGHGLTASIESENLLDIFEWHKLSNQTKLVRYDARGHGKTEASFSPGDYHWKNLANDMLSVASEVGVDKFIAGGQSMGCASTIYSAMLAPDRIKSMVLINPPTAWDTRKEQSQFYLKLARVGGFLGGWILAKLISKNPERLLPGWLVEAKKENINGVFEGLKPIKRKTLANLFKGAALTDLPSKEELKSINVPTLILAWTGDPSHPVETATELHQVMPNTELHIADGYSDLQHWSQLIRDFVSKTK
ncbi:alpha/beta hydrolase [Thalassotalea psychrophila]|uniref:Alpha/beta hydrolase n=1 Tax=Thalassotalea psychrophila TaxID=3065647 RepID=A0ABY9TYB7_9GAMM|nr:alpha/beta hydrolase [Colwelliaceae bacterium SQ149]